MPANPFREAGLPDQIPDQGGPHMRWNQELAFVRAVYPEIMCADIQPQSGGMIYKAQIADHVVPDVHIDDERPSYVEFWHRGGQMQDVWCRRVHWRRFKGPEAAGEPEKRYYHKHLTIERHGDITIRITPKNEIYLYDSETNDYCLYEQETRTFHVKGPHIFLGTDDENRIELHTQGSNDEMRLVIPRFAMGKLGLADTDGVSYLQDQLLHLMSDVIKLTASSSIILDPPHIYLGNELASQRLILGDLFQAFYNAFVALFNSHSHSNVQNGPGTSGPPTTPTNLMGDNLLSTIARVSE